MSWCVLSGSPLGFADVMANGPVMSHRCAVTVWSGTRIMMLSLVPTRSYAGPTPKGKRVLGDYPRQEHYSKMHDGLSQLCSLTKLEEPVTLWHDAADASRVNVSHELPQQRAEWRLGCHKLLHTGDTDTDGLLCRTVLPSRKAHRSANKC